MEEAKVNSNELEPANRIKFIKKRKCFIIQIIGDAEKINIAGFNKEIANLLSDPENVLIDCFFTTNITTQWAHIISFLQQPLELENYVLKLFHIPGAVREKLQLLTFFQNTLFADNFYDAIHQISERNLVQVEETYGIQKILTLTIIKSFFLELKMPYTAKQPYYEENNPEQFSGDISAVGPVMIGETPLLLSLSLPRKTFFQLATKVYNTEVTTLDCKYKEVVSNFYHYAWEDADRFLSRGNADITWNDPSIALTKEMPQLGPWKDSFNNFSLKDCHRIVIPFIGPLGKFFAEVVFPSTVNTEKVQELFKGY